LIGETLLVQLPRTGKGSTNNFQTGDFNIDIGNASLAVSIGLIRRSSKAQEKLALMRGEIAMTFDHGVSRTAVSDRGYNVYAMAAAIYCRLGRETGVCAGKIDLWTTTCDYCSSQCRLKSKGKKAGDRPRAFSRHRGIFQTPHR
jgi:hypothetical protein